MATSYRVTAPYVTLKVKDAAGAEVLVGFYEGAVVSDVDPDSLQHHLDGGMLEKATAGEFNEGGGGKTAPAKKDD